VTRCVQWGVAADESKVYVAVSDVRLDVGAAYFVVQQQRDRWVER
jgi:hypothetical protein